MPDMQKIIRTVKRKIIPRTRLLKKTFIKTSTVEISAFPVGVPIIELNYEEQPTTLQIKNVLKATGLFKKSLKAPSSMQIKITLFSSKYPLIFL
jgi:hypothetical protein